MVHLLKGRDEEKHSGDAGGPSTARRAVQQGCRAGYLGKCRGRKGHARRGNIMSQSLEVGVNKADGTPVRGLAWS